MRSNEHLKLEILIARKCYLQINVLMIKSRIRYLHLLYKMTTSHYIKKNSSLRIYCVYVKPRDVVCLNLQG